MYIQLIENLVITIQLRRIYLNVDVEVCALFYSHPCIDHENSSSEKSRTLAFRSAYLPQPRHNTANIISAKLILIKVENYLLKLPPELDDTLLGSLQSFSPAISAVLHSCLR